MPTVPDYIQTEDRSFLRDTRSKALLNTDKAALARNRAARSKSLRHANTIATLQSDVAALTALVHQLMAEHANTNPRHI